MTGLAHPPITVACHGLAKRVTCTAKGTLGGISYNLVGTFVVSGGSAVEKGPVRSVLFNAPMARSASAWSHVAKTVAADAAAKELAHTAQVAIETYGTDHNGTYKGASPTVLDQYEATIPIKAGNGVVAFVYKAAAMYHGRGYVVATVATTGDEFGIVRLANGRILRICKGSHLTCNNGTW
jgi:hypothetical protein